jgi:AcrR family transcriptional regulator
MKTRERIIHVSLELFNIYGEPNVTTLQIADELDISPGNLYYHYKNKTEIIVELFVRYELEIKNLLDVSPDADFNLEDYWLFLHFIFECIAKYRFLYKDLVNILQRYDKIRHKFKKILRQKNDSSKQICSRLQQQNILQVNSEELEALCDNIVLISTYWPSYDILNNLGKNNDIDLAKGIYQIMSLISPHLRTEERKLVIAMAKQYL